MMKQVTALPTTGFVPFLFTAALAVTVMTAGCTPDKSPAMKDDNSHTGMKMKDGQTTMPMGSMTMDSAFGKGMMDDLNAKTGDEFDKAFLAMMILHHRQALDMAQRAKSVAKHEEIKKLSDDIIAAQSKEIEQMRQWHKQWGYGE